MPRECGDDKRVAILNPLCVLISERTLISDKGVVGVQSRVSGNYVR